MPTNLNNLVQDPFNEIMQYLPFQEQAKLALVCKYTYKGVNAFWNKNKAELQQRCGSRYELYEHLLMDCYDKARAIVLSLPAITDIHDLLDKFPILADTKEVTKILNRLRYINSASKWTIGAGMTAAVSIFLIFLIPAGIGQYTNYGGTVDIDLVNLICFKILPPIDGATALSAVGTGIYKYKSSKNLENELINLFLQKAPNNAMTAAESSPKAMEEGRLNPQSATEKTPLMLGIN
jgi:hypothetical protein